MSATVQRCYGILVGLAKLSHQLPFETKKVIIEGLVHPHIRHCLSVWGSCSKSQKHIIQKTLNFAARIITGIKRTEHISPALETLDWLKVAKILTERDLSTLHHILRSPNTSEKNYLTFSFLDQMCQREPRVGLRVSCCKRHVSALSSPAALS